MKSKKSLLLKTFAFFEFEGSNWLPPVQSETACCGKAEKRANEELAFFREKGDRRGEVRSFHEEVPGCFHNLLQIPAGHDAPLRCRGDVGEPQARRVTASRKDCLGPRSLRSRIPEGRRGNKKRQEASAIRSGP